MSTNRNKSQYEYTILSTEDDVHDEVALDDDTGAHTKQSPPAIDFKWSAIVLNRSDYNENVLETAIAKPVLRTARNLSEQWPEKSFWRILMRPKQFALIVLLTIVMLYALSSTTANDVTNVLHEAMHTPAMKEATLPLPPMLVTTPAISQNNGDNCTEKVTPAKVETLQPMSHATTARTAALTTRESSDTTSAYTRNTANTTITVTTTDKQLPSQRISANNDPPAGYLVWSERCKMPNLDPLLPEVMKYFKAQKYKPCSTVKPLTQLRFNGTLRRYSLSVNELAIPEYKAAGGIISCCYQSVERNYTGAMADYKYSLSECMSFRESTMLAPTIQSIIVRCRAKNAEIYVDAYALVNDRPDVMQRLNEWQQLALDKMPAAEENATYRAPNVLLVGIDSISRSNLIRAMPRTAKYLHDNHWFPLNGFNKIADNTYPNLMAILTGYNPQNAKEKCKPNVVGGLDKCTYIWDLFQQHGYATAYGEDDAFLHTFNNGKKGFLKPPTDYYMRPFYLSAEKALHLQRKSGLVFCMGYKHAAEYTYDYAIEFARRFRNYTHFGLFWTNSFSHNALSDPSSMDERMEGYLKQFEAEGILANSIVIFFSDHGIRFGEVRRTLSGHYEERLPFMFFWLPEYFRKAHPEFVDALNLNKNRLTNFYDVHMTLKHVLQLNAQMQVERGRKNASASFENDEQAYGDEVLAEPAEGCAECQTLLKPVPENRSCEDIAIEDHWCTCIPYESVSIKTKLIQKLAKFVVDYINNFLQQHPNKSISKQCAKLEVDKVENANRALLPAYLTETNSTTAKPYDKYRLIIYTKPNKGIFESTVRYATDHNQDLMEITGDISRLNSYATDSKCISDSHAKKYCSCAKKRTKGK